MRDVYKRQGHSTEYHDSKISLFSAQKGKCAISGEEFADAEHVAVIYSQSDGEEKHTKPSPVPIHTFFLLSS